MARKRKAAATSRLAELWGELSRIINRVEDVEAILERPDGAVLIRQLADLAERAPERLDELLGGDLGWVAQLGREIAKAKGYGDDEDDAEPSAPARVLPFARPAAVEAAEPEPAS